MTVFVNNNKNSVSDNIQNQYHAHTELKMSSWDIYLKIFRTSKKNKRKKENRINSIQYPTSYKKQSKIKQIRNSYYAKPVMTRGISVCQCLVPTKSDLESTKVSSIYKFQTQIISLIFYVSNLYVILHKWTWLNFLPVCQYITKIINMKTVPIYM